MHMRIDLGFGTLKRGWGGGGVRFVQTVSRFYVFAGIVASES